MRFSIRHGSTGFEKRLRGWQPHRRHKLAEPLRLCGFSVRSFPFSETTPTTLYAFFNKYDQVKSIDIIYEAQPDVFVYQQDLALVIA